MRLTEQQYADMQSRRLKQGDRGSSAGRDYVLASKPKKSKFKNIRCQSHDGHNFASRLERDYYEQLFLRWKAGEVRWFIRQPSFDLEGGVIYRADFLVVLAFGDVEVIDCKGFQTRESINKIKQVKARYGIEVRLVGARRAA